MLVPSIFCCFSSLEVHTVGITGFREFILEIPEVCVATPPLSRLTLLDRCCSEKRCLRSPVGFRILVCSTGSCFLVRIILAFLNPSLFSVFIWFQTWLSTNKDSLERKIRVLTMMRLLRFGSLLDVAG